MKKIGLFSSVFSSCLFLAGCIGPPEKTEFYQELIGPNVSGCLNGYHVVENEGLCEDFRVGDVFIEVMPRGSKKYYQDPEKSPYKIPAVVCSVQRKNDFDFKNNVKIDDIVVSTNTGKKFTEFEWGFGNYNSECKYLFVKPRLDLNVEEDRELHVKIRMTVLSPEVATKEINFAFEGKSEWYLPFYGP
ncbi:hypothetical protein KUV22_05795 [Microbulbifer agarilyticus]|uniref:hypothetical protein n=1 Tax=Microbulbifer agarilyticus TaxID=260552 RepID=UPI001C937998|nr:hypothetical protein [Microbulbifer agarilyticus]MBY6189930.1 hypothetical protein [Microbulbifer agarilyticus]